MAMPHNCALGNNNRKSIRQEKRSEIFGHPSNCLEVPWEIFVPTCKVSSHKKDSSTTSGKEEGTLFAPMHLLRVYYPIWSWKKH